MSLELKVEEEVALRIWNDHHNEIEKLGYSININDFMYMIGPDDTIVVAAIRPNYSLEMGKKFREIIPLELEYKSKKYKIAISPSFGDLIKNSEKIYD